MVSSTVFERPKTSKVLYEAKTKSQLKLETDETEDEFTLPSKPVPTRKEGHVIPMLEYLKE